MYAPWSGPEQPTLLELKTLHYGISTYGGSAQRCGAVARRAQALPAEYAAKARRLDAQFNGTEPEEVGPVQLQLQSFGQLRGLVFGAWGEASPDVELLLSFAASTGAQRHWQRMGSTDEAAACGALAWLLRRRWGMTALRECARLKLDRLELVGRGAAAAASRRAAAASAYAFRARSAAVLAATRGPRLRSLRVG